MGSLGTRIEKVAARTAPLDERIPVAIATASYEKLLEFAAAAASARTSIAYGLVTLSALLLTWYNNLATVASAASETMRDFVPATGLWLCWVLMYLGWQRYVEECQYTKEAIDVEFDNGTERGAGSVRAEMLSFDNWWVPCRSDIAGFCCAIAWITIFVVHYWK
jgi:hypothetical protein